MDYRCMLDTNILVYLRDCRSNQLKERFDSLGFGRACISSIALYKLYYGVYKSRNPNISATALNKALFPVEVVSFDDFAAIKAGELRAMFSKDKPGSIIGASDLLIAAHALSLDLPLITHNTAEFSRVPGLRVEDWAFDI